jgi:hypothetical protein
MANEKKTKLEPMDIDNFDIFGMDDPIAATPTPKHKNKREAVTEITTSFARGAASVAKDAEQMRRFAASALPDGYGSAINTGFEINKQARQLYNDAVTELRPAMPFFQRMAGRLTAKKHSFLPNSVEAKLRAFAEAKGDTGFIETQQQRDESNIQGSLGEIFKTQMEYGAQQNEENTLRQTVRDQMQLNQSRGQATLLEQIRANTARQVGFQDQITSRYMKKSLELQFRQYLGIRDLLQIAQRRERTDAEYLGNIMKNTGLPDYQKLHTREAAAANFRDRLLDRGHKSVMNYVSDFTKNFSKSISTSMRSTLGGLASAAQMGESGMESAQWAAEMEREMEQMGMPAESRTKKHGKLAGQMVSEFTLPFLAAPIRKLLSRNKKLQQTGSRLGMASEMLPERLNEWAQSDTNSSSWMAPLIWMLKDAIPKFDMDRSLGESPIVGADKPVPFDSLTRRSITEVIPGFLSRILREVTVLRTGDETTGTVIYNMDRGEFTTKAQAAKDAARRLFAPAETKQYRAQVDALMSKIGGEEMTEQQRKELMRQMTRDVASGRTFNLQRYTTDEHATPDMSLETKQALEQIFNKKFRGQDGKLDQTELLGVTRQFGQLRNYYADPKKKMSVYRDAGQRELLDEVGVVGRLGFSDRVNYDLAHDILLGLSDNAYLPSDGTHEGAPLGAAAQRKWTPGGMDASKSADQFSDRVVNSVDSIVDKLSGRNLGGLKARAKSKLYDAMRRTSKVSSVDLEQGYAKLSEQGRAAVAAVVSRAAGMRVTAQDLFAGASRIFDNLKPEDRRQVETIIGEAGGPDAAHESMETATPAPRPSPRPTPTVATATANAAPSMGPSTPPPQAPPEYRQSSQADTSDAWDRLVTVNEAQLEQLQNILTAIIANGGGNGGGGEAGEQSGGGGFMRGLLGKFGRAGGAVARWYGRYTAGVLKAPFTIARFGLNAAKSVFGTRDVVADIYVVGETTPILKKRKLLNGDYRDLKTKKPVRLIKDIKGPVVDLSQPDAAPVVDAEMCERGFYTLVDGKPSMVRRLAGIAGGVLTTVTGAYAQMFKLPFMLTGGAARLATAGLRKMFNAKKDVFVKGQPDPTRPRLRAVLMDGRNYFTERGRGVTSIKQLNGQTIFAKDRQTILIGPDDYEAGLVDIHGRRLETTANRMLGAAGRLVGGVTSGLASLVGGAARGVGKLIGGAYNLAGGVLGGGMRKLGGMFGMGGDSSVSSARQVDLLQRIHDMLDARLPGRTFRRGSWQERLANAQKDKQDKKTAAGTTKSMDMLGALSKLFSKGSKSLASLFGFGDDDEEGEDGGGNTTILAGGGGAADAKDAKRKRRLERARANKVPKGKLGKLWAATGGRLSGLFGKAGAAAGATKLGGKLGRLKPRGFGLGGLLTTAGMYFGGNALIDKLGGSKTTAGRAASTAVDVGGDAMTLASLWSMLGGGGGAAAAAGTAGAAGAGAAAAGGAGAAAAGTAGTAGAAGAGITLGIPLAIAAAIGYSGYKGYKTYKYSGFTALRGYRMTQYGIDYNDAKDCERVVDLEQMLEQTVKPMGSGLDLVSNEIHMDDIYKLFGVDDGWFTNNSDERKMFDVWFNGRFKPIYLRWQAELRTIAGGTSLQDVDDKLKAEDAQRLIRAVRNVDPGTYAIKAGPFGDLLDITADRVQEVYIRAERELKDKAEGKGGLARGLRKLNSGLMGTNIVFGSQFNRMTDWVEQKRDDMIQDNSPAAIASLIGDVGKGSTQGGTVGYGGITVSAAASVGLAGSGQLSALQGVRLRTYGLGAMDKDRVAQLLMMERDMLAKTVARPGSPATTDLHVGDAWSKYGLQFGLDVKDQGARERWVTWFQYRFTPTVLAYATAASKALNSTDLSGIDARLSPSQKYEVAVAVSQAKCGQGYDIPVWKVFFSPWDINERLNQDIRTIHGPLLALKEGVKTDPVGEERVAGQEAKLKSNSARLNQVTSTGNAGAGFIDRAKSWLMGGNGQASLFTRGVDTVKTMASSSASAVSNLFSGNFAAAGGDALRTITAPVNGIFGLSTNHPGNGTGGSINDLPLPGQGHDSNNANQRKSALQNLIYGAAKMVGVNPALMMTIAGIESAWRAAAGASTSSAKGLYQFVSGTWNGMLRKYGKKYGIAPGTSPYDPRANTLLGAEFLRENAQILRSAMKRDPTDTELYAAHFMGPDGAAKMLQMDPSTNAVKAFPAAALANKPIFYNADGSARSVSQVMAELDRRVAQFRDPHAAPPVASFANVTGIVNTTAKPGSTSAADFSGVTSSVSSGSTAGASVGPVATAVAASAPTVTSGTAAPAAVATGASSGSTPEQAQQYAQTQSIDTMARSQQVQQNVSLQKTEGLLADQLDVQRKLLETVQAMANMQLDRYKADTGNTSAPERSNAVAPTAAMQSGGRGQQASEAPDAPMPMLRRQTG